MARGALRLVEVPMELSPPWAVRTAAAAVCAALLVGQRASAQVSGSWMGQSGPYPRLWSDGSLWTSGPLYPDGGGGATFGPEASGSLQLDRSVTLSTIAIDNAVAPDGIAVYAVGSNRVTLTGVATLHAGPYSAITAAYWGPLLRVPLVSSVGLVKTGPGALNVDFGDPSVASGAAQPLQGDVRVNAGTLLVTPTSAYPLGNPANRIVLDGGGRVGLSPNSTNWALSHPIVVGAGGGGISNPGGGTLTVASTVSGAGAFLIGRDETQAASGRVVFTANNPLSGALTHESQDVLALTGAGAFTAIPSLTLYGRAELDYAAGAVNRLPDAAPVTLAGGGALTLVAPSAGPAEERVGALRLGGGEVAVAFTTSSTSKDVALRAASLDRAGRGVLRVDAAVGQGTAGGRLMFDAAPVVVGSGPAGGSTVGVVPGVVTLASSSSSYALATYSPTTGLRALTPAEQGATLATPGGAHNVFLTADATVSGPTTVNSLTLSTAFGSTHALGGSGTVVVNSGAILGRDAAWTVNAPVDFAGREAVVYAAEDLTFAGRLSNADGLSVAGGLDRRVTLSGANTFGGAVTLDGGGNAAFGWGTHVHVIGSVLKNVAGPLGNSAAPVVFAGIGGELRLDSAGATFGRDLQVGPGPSGWGGFAGWSTSLTGNVSGSGTLAVRGGVDVSGTLSGGVTLEVQGGGTTRLRATASTFTGGVRVVSGGVLAPNANGVLGSGRLAFALDDVANAPPAPALLADAVALRVTNEVDVTGGAEFRGTQAIELAGPVELRALNLSTPFLDVGVPVTVSGPLGTGASGGAVEKRGAGTLSLRGPHRLASVTVGQGAVEFAAAAAAPARPLSAWLSGTGVLRLTPGRDKPLRALNLGLADQSAVDLTDNAMAVVGLGAGAAGKYVKSGYGAGKWDGPGVRSGTVAAEPSRYGVGYAPAAKVLDFSAAGGAGTGRAFAGMTVAAGDLLFRPTLLGDATLDGRVNFADLLSLARSYSGTGRAWYEGDFNYDGAVNFADLLALARNYSQAVPADPVPGAPAGFGQDLAAAFAAAVPEPSGVLGWGMVGALAIPARRRRRRTGPRAVAS